MAIDHVASGIRLSGLSVDYRTPAGPLRAVDGISIDISAGEFVAVLGPSGCGKSTILRVLAGLLPPSEGAAEIGGIPMNGPRRDIGVVFQDPTLLPWKTILENVQLPGRIMGLDPVASKARALKLLEMLGLSGFQTYYPGQLSGGMRQRAGIARGLVHNPGVLLMDEPFGALDAMTREQMNVEIQRIWWEDRKTVLFITHSINEAVYLADRIVVLTSRPGRVAEIIVNDLPRPRSVEIMATSAFQERAGYLRRLFNVGSKVD